jgi:hypothetical protein
MSGMLRRLGSAPASKSSWYVELEVTQAHVINLRMLVPAKHGVDSLGELCAGGLVDTASVTPEELSGPICPRISHLNGQRSVKWM